MPTAECPDCGSHDTRREHTEYHQTEIEVSHTCWNEDCDVAHFVEKFSRYNSEVVDRD